MKSLDNLRRCFDGFTLLSTTTAKSVVNEKADEIERELKKRYIELPLDADGIPVRVGDKVVSKYGEETRVIAVSGRAFVTASDQISLRRSSAFHHKRDVSDVLREFAIACEDAGNAGDAVNRLISEYAERLQLKEE